MESNLHWQWKLCSRPALLPGAPHVLILNEPTWCLLVRIPEEAAQAFHIRHPVMAAQCMVFSLLGLQEVAQGIPSTNQSSNSQCFCHPRRAVWKALPTSSSGIHLDLSPVPPRILSQLSENIPEIKTQYSFKPPSHKRILFLKNHNKPYE